MKTEGRRRRSDGARAALLRMQPGARPRKEPL